MSKNIKARNYKHMLQTLSKTHEIIVTISIWTYHSKRMIFKLDFERMHHIFDRDMEFKNLYKDKVDFLNFKTINGDKFNFEVRKLKIAKVDFVELTGKDV